MAGTGLSAPVARLSMGNWSAPGRAPTPRVSSGELARQRDEEKLLYFQQSSSDFFDFYRRGDANWDEGTRRSVFRFLRLPLPGSVPEFTKEESDRLWNQASQYDDLLFEYEQPDPPIQRPDDPPKRVMIGVNNASKKLGQSGLSFKRVLGYGGNGAAALFEGKSVTTGRIEKFVAKTHLRRSGNLYREKYYGRVGLLFVSSACTSKS